MKHNTLGNGGHRSDAIPVDAVTSDTSNRTIVLYQNMEHFDAAGFQLITTGTLTGAWKVYVSDDWFPFDAPAAVANAYPPSSPLINSAIRWTEITSDLSPGLSAVSGASNQQLQLAPLGHKAAKIEFNWASNSGTVTITRYCKGNS